MHFTADIKTLIRLHCDSIPHSESHYTREDSEFNYFDNVNFTFQEPRRDVCNFCEENKINPTAGPELEQHLQDIKEYHELRAKLLKDKSILCCEFDFAQNFPIPKLSVNEQFYRQLGWIHLFNVHIYCEEFEDNRSYMFPFIEGNVKKGANTVANHLLYAIEKEFELKCYNSIYLFSDSCGGQKKNYHMIKFHSLLSKRFHVNIQRVFSVKGHSYCKCDRNFSLYGRKK